MKQIFRFQHSGRSLDSLSGFFFAVFWLFTTANPLHAQWMATNGPYGGLFMSFAVSGTNIFAGGSSGGGVFLSTDNGTSWTAVNNGLTDTRVRALAISDTNIFAGTYGGGVFLSTDNGTHWTAVNNGLTQSYVISLAVSGTNIFAGTYGFSDGVFLSTDNGGSWTLVSSGLTDTHVYALAVSGTNIFAGTGDGVFLSTDNGTSWTAHNIGLTNHSVNTLALSGTNLFAGTQGGGVFLSTNNGAGWTAVDSGLTNTIVQALAVSDTNLIAGTHGGGVFLSTNNGASWIATNSGLTNTNIYALTFSGTNMFAGTNGDGVFLSTNYGSSWTSVTTGLTNTNVMALVVSPDSSRNLFAGTFGSGLFFSTNSGASWIATGLAYPYVQALAVSPNGAGGTNLFAGTYGGGVFHSTDNGSSWNAANTGLTAYIIQAIAVSGTNLFAGTMNYSGGGVFRSTNNGASWIVTNSGLANTDVVALAVSGTNLFAGTQGGGVFRSTNDGTSWTAVNTGLTNTSILALAVTPNGTNIFAGTYGGVFHSSNNGTSWTAASNGLTNTTVQALTSDLLGNLFAGTRGGGIFLSTDNGTSWSAANSGMTDVTVQAFAVSGTNLFVGVAYGAVWRRPLSEMVTLNGVFSASTSSLLFGNVPRYSVKQDSIMITNIGDTTLVIDSARVIGGQFSLVPDSASILAPLEKKKYTISFAPTSGGAQSGNVVFWHNGQSSRDTVHVSGTGTQAIFSDAPGNISLGVVPVASTKTDSIMVKNFGMAPLIISSVSSNDSELTVTPTTATIAALDSQKFIVAFSPLNQYVMRFDTVTFLHNADGSPGKLVCIATGLTTIAGEVAAGWNMVAVPLLVNDFRKSSLYPTASSSAFAYDGSYKRRDTLEIGIGYWVKFSSAQEVSYVGPIVARETIDVRVSWNMIGSITSPIPVNTITSLPGGIITSKFYTYSGSYVYDDTIRPGNAYWVKVNEAGKLILATSPSIVPANRIRIERTSETPPQPPEAEISHLKSEIPEQFALEQNYPNPFNPVTVIRYSLPVSGRVTMKVYTMLGEEVGTLVDETQDAGYWSVRWDASRAPSGVYIYKLTAESFVDVKKMILIK